MNRTMTSIVFAGLVALSAQVLADDSTPTMTQKHQMMKECMARQKAKDSSVSKADMKAACKNEMSMKKDASDRTTDGQTDTPHN